MTVKYFYNPYDKQSRDSLLQLQSGGADIQIVHRLSPADDCGFWVSCLPTSLLHDDDGITELARIDDPKQMTIDNIKWMHIQHAAWKAKGRPKNTNGTPNFPIPPWANGKGAN